MTTFAREGRSLANSLAHQFLRSANHLAWRAKAEGRLDFRVDLLSGALDPGPDPAEPARDENLVALVQRTLRTQARRLGATLIRADLVCRFDLGDSGPDLPAECHVQLEDATGRRAEGVCREAVIPQP